MLKTLILNSDLIKIQIYLQFLKKNITSKKQRTKIIWFDKKEYGVLSFFFYVD